MTEKRYFAHKHLFRENKVHDKICHNFMSLDETVEHMNNQYWKYKQLKEENEQLKSENQRLSEQKHIYKQDWKHLCIDKELLDSENEKLKQENNDLIKLINDLGSEEMDRQMEEILNN